MGENVNMSASSGSALKIPGLVAVALLVVSLVFAVYHTSTFKEPQWLAAADDLYRGHGTVNELKSASLRLRSLLAAMQPDGGRSKHYGRWYSLTDPFEFYVFSAFYDDRRSLGSLPVVRVIAVSEALEGRDDMLCVLFYRGSKKPRFVSAKTLDIGIGVDRHSKVLKEYIITCPLESEEKPSNITFTLSSSHSPKWILPVEYPFKPPTKKKFMVCVSVTYWKQNPHQVVEWMELLRELGVSKVTVYNNSLTPESARIFQYFDRIGFVDFRQSWSFIPDLGEPTIHLHMSPVINDCMYRNMYAYDKIVVTDFDEVIIPRKPHLYTYRQMLQEIDDKQDQSTHPARHYRFRNAYFFSDIPHQDKTKSKYLKTLRYRWRVSVSPYGYAIKSIISPLACVNMHNHFCWGSTKMYDTSGLDSDVEPEYGLNQHYKKCHFDEYERPGMCHEMIRDQAVEDNAMLKYEKNLTINVAKHLKILNLDPL